MTAGNPFIRFFSLLVLSLLFFFYSEMSLSTNFNATKFVYRLAAVVVCALGMFFPQESLLEALEEAVRSPGDTQDRCPR